MKRISQKINFKTILLLSYIIITLILTITHEPWRDEAQSWLIAKNLNPLEIINQMKYEGHPCLWHLILYPFANLNFPYQTINILSWTISCIAIILIIKKSKFPNYLNILILLTYPILYYYSAFARSYSLILLGLAILTHLYPKRKEKPYLYGITLALLANTHILIAGFVLSLLLKDFYELLKTKNKKTKPIIGFSIELLGILLLFLQLISSLNTNTETKIASNSTIFSFFSSIFQIFQLIVNGNYFMFLLIFLGFLGILISFYQNKKILWILLISIGFLLGVHTFVYSFGLQHAVLILLIVLFCAILAYENNLKNKLLELSLALFFTATIPYSLNLSISDLQQPYSNSKAVAQYIQENIEEETNFLCTHDAKAESIIPYLNNTYHFLSQNTEKEFTYITWSKERKNYKNYDDLIRIIQEKNITYIIHSQEYNQNEITQLEKNGIITHVKNFTQKNRSVEEYILYKVTKEKL